MEIITFVLTLVFAIATMLNETFGNSDFTVVFKTLASIFFVLTPIFAYKKYGGDKSFFRIILAGLIFSLFGDVFLATHFSFSFTFGVLSFTLAQVLFFVGFVYLVKISVTDVVVFAIIATTLILVQNFVPGFDYKGSYMIILLYTFIISAMLAKAFSLSRIKAGNEKLVALIITAMTLFFLSDFTLLFGFFYKTKFGFILYLNLSMYYLAQALLGISFTKPIKKLDN